MVGACYTLFRMRASLATGMRRAVSDLKKSSSQAESTLRTERDLSAKVVFAGLGATFLCMIALYFYFTGVLSGAIVAAVLMVSIGVSGVSGVAAVLGVAAVVCVSSAVAGEMLQDLKVGHILGGTPKLMQIGDILGIVVASAVLYFPLLW